MEGVLKRCGSLCPSDRPADVGDGLLDVGCGVLARKSSVFLSSLRVVVLEGAVPAGFEGCPRCLDEFHGEWGRWHVPGICNLAPWLG